MVQRSPLMMMTLLLLLLLLLTPTQNKPPVTNPSAKQTRNVASPLPLPLFFLPYPISLLQSGKPRSQTPLLHQPLNSAGPIQICRCVNFFREMCGYWVGDLDGGFRWTDLSHHSITTAAPLGKVYLLLHVTCCFRLLVSFEPRGIRGYCCRHSHPSDLCMFSCCPGRSRLW